MSDQPKVFEFAKEIGMETLSLMDKIREWDLPVKSHMASLSEDVIVEIKKRLDEDAGSGKSAKKKTTRKKSVAKKKTAKKAATTKKATAKKTVAKKVTAKKATTKKVAAKKTTAKKATTSAGAKKIVKKRTVIRRKAGEPTAAEEEAAKVAAAEAAAEAAAAAEALAAEAPDTDEATEATEHAVATEAATAPAEGEAPAAVAAPVATNPDGTPVRPRARGKIVGRMDLSRVQKREPKAADSSQVRSRATGPRNIRPGFVAPLPVEAPQQNFTDKAKDKVPPKKKVGAGGKEVPVQSFASTEFRKREVIFQPKKKRVFTKGEGKQTQITMPKASKRIVKIHETISVSELAQAMGIKFPQLTKKLMAEGVMAKMSTILDFDTVALIAPEFNFEAVNVHLSEDDLLQDAAYGDLSAETISRPPVVTVMGHVDHGKTTLLDAIRKADVVSGEAGGITQHIGAYRVSLDGGRVATFIDTPGHEAFTAMRARGANVTDVAIIVVAADDGVMPQTVEAINHAKAAGVPIIVAVNKIDRPGANIDRIKQQLTEHELVPEEWGGTTIFCEVSALQKQGITELLEQIHLVAEMLELKANPKRSATGIVIESRQEKGRGNVATVLIQDGTAKVGESFVAGQVVGRVRRMNDDHGKVVKLASPGEPVEIIGLPDSPMAGDRFDAVQSEEMGQKVSEFRLKQQEVADNPSSKMSLEDIFSKMKSGDVQELSIVLKSDVAGSSEAVKGMLAKLDTDEVKVKVIHSGVGGISESDVLLASTAKGLILGFNVRPDTGAQRLAKEKGTEIKTYKIIYELVDDVKKAMSGLLKPDMVETSTGSAEVREIFSVPKLGVIAGCMVTDGKISRSDQVRLVRDGRMVFEGNIVSLKRFKDDAKEVQSGYECGIGIENYNDIKAGDTIETFVIKEVKREL